MTPLTNTATANGGAYQASSVAQYPQSSYYGQNSNYGGGGGQASYTTQNPYGTQYGGRQNDMYGNQIDSSSSSRSGQQQSTTPSTGQYVNQGSFGNQNSGFYNPASTRYLSSAGGTYSEVTSECGASEQEKLTLCAQDLIALGLFGVISNQQQLIKQLTLSDVMSQQQAGDFLSTVCSAYSRFNQCLRESSTIKQSCYGLDSMKTRFAIPDAGLNYACGEGYRSLLQNWNCLMGAYSSGKVAECESRVLQNSVIAQQQQQQQTSALSLNQSPGAMCNALQTYANCIKQPIESSCGRDAVDAAIMGMERKARVVVPFCTLGAGAILPSLLLIIISFILTVHS